MKGDVARALSYLMEAVAERDKARGNCDHSWGYFGHSYEERVERAETDFIDELRKALATSAGKEGEG